MLETTVTLFYRSSCIYVNVNNKILDNDKSWFLQVVFCLLQDLGNQNRVSQLWRFSVFKIPIVTVNRTSESSILNSLIYFYILMDNERVSGAPR